MKSTMMILLGLAAGVCWGSGQTVSAVRGAERPRQGDYTITGRGAHHRVWERTVWRTNALGQGLLQTNRFTELASGLHRLENGVWVEARPEIVITADGALGRGAGHEVRFPGNLNTRGGIQIRTPDGQWLKGHVLGLAYHDLSSGTNILIAELKDSVGQLAGSNQVIYPDAFTDFRADVRYTYRKAGIEQDVILREQPPSPAAYGLNPRRTHLLVFTEFTEAPSPQAVERVLPSGRARLSDQTVSLGTMKMGRGRAFALREGKRQRDIAVTKRWEVLEGRNFLVERVEYPAVQRELLRLPPAENTVTNAGPAVTGRGFAAGTVPPVPRFAKAQVQPVIRTAALAPRDGFVMDWDYVWGEDWWEFWCGETYLVVGECHVYGAWFEPGSVIKYDWGCSMHVDGPFYGAGGTCNGTAYALLTSVNDDAHGEWIDWSSGYPAAGDYGPALVVQAEDLSAAQSCVQVLYGDPGIIAAPPPPPTVTITASDPVATKDYYGWDAAAFTLVRSGGDWSEPLTVYLAASGTATEYVDYWWYGAVATIPAEEESVEVMVYPLGPGGTLYDATLRVTIEADAAYEVGAPDRALVTIYNPTIPPPPPIPAPSGLVGWWRGENNAQDSAGANHGSLLNGVAFSSYGKVAQAFSLDGTDDRVVVPDATALNFGANADFSIEAWIRPETASTAYGVQTIVDKRYTPNDWTATGYAFCLVNGQVACQLAVAGSPVNYGPAGDDLRDGELHHVALTLDRDSTTGGKLYVDGALVLTFNPTGRQGSLTNAQPFRIGNHAHATLNAHMKGLIDEASLYNRCLTATEIQSIHAAGRGGKFLDTDADGLPDEWEMQYFGNLNQGPDDDPDGDGLTNIIEYRYGLNPTVADSQDDSDGDGLPDVLDADPWTYDNTAPAFQITSPAANTVY